MVTLVVLVASLAGAVLAGVQLADRGAHTLTGEVPVSFGAAVVGTATAVNAVPASAMPGMSHEPPAADQSRRVLLPVTLVNRSAAPVAYAPGQFRLLVAGADAAAPDESPLLTGDVRPGAAVSLRLLFTVPGEATAARLALDPADPARTVEVPLPGAGGPAVEDPPAADSPPATPSAGRHAGH